MFIKVIKTLNKLIERLSPKQLLAGTAAIGILVACMVYLTLSHIQGSVKVEKTAPADVTKVVVAKVDIPRGVVIRREMLTLKDFAVKSLPKGTTNDIESFVNLPTKLEIFAGDVLTKEKVFSDYRQAGFVGMIPDNCRAVTIPVNNLTAAAGLIKAGDLVDILLVSGANQGSHSEVVLQNVLLLSINRNANRYIQDTSKPKATQQSEDQEADKKNDDTDKKADDDSKAKDEQSNETDAEKKDTNSEKPAPIPAPREDVGSVTLALKPDDVTKITALISQGRFYLALRPFKPRGDSMYITETDYYTATKGAQPPRPANPPAPPVPVIPAAPPVANVAQPALPAGSQPADKKEGFEIIRWGN